MQITIPDEIIGAVKIVLMVLGVAAILVIIGVGLWHCFAPAAVQNPPVVTTPTPAPTPTAFIPYWTGSLEITGMQTGSGPQIDCANGQSFYVSWQDYYRLQLHQLVSFHVVSTSNPYGTVMFNADQVVVTGYAWGYYNPYQYGNGNDPRVVYGSAGRFCIDGGGKYAC